MAHSLQSTPHMTLRQRAKRAFTLVELMIVIVIIAILAVLATVAYRSLVLSAHAAEATQMIQSIRTAQEAYHAETQTYVSTSTALNSGLYPNSTPSNVKTGWGSGITGSCTPPTASVNCWSALPLHVDSAVMFGYATMAGAAGSAPSGVSGIPTGLVTLPSTSAMDWYVISAVGDVNANGIFCTIIGTSLTNDLFIQNEGE